jgi:hypothetical protein
MEWFPHYRIVLLDELFKRAAAATAPQRPAPAVQPA